MLIVTTPTGHIGSQLLPILLSSGAPVRAIARDPEKLTPHPNLQIVQGSTDDAATLARAFEGAQSVFWCVPSPMKAPDVAAHYARFSAAAAQALNAQTDLPRVITVSSAAYADEDAPRGASVVSDALHAMEQTLDATGAPTCHLRNGFFMDNLLSALPRLKSDGVLSFPLPADRPLAMVASADIARVAAQEMQREQSGQTRRVLYAGWYEMNRVAALIAAGANREIRFEQADPESTRAMLLQHGATPSFVETYLGMCAALDENAYNWQAHQPDAQTITLEEFVNQKIVPALGAGC